MFSRDVILPKRVEFRRFCRDVDVSHFVASITRHAFNVSCLIERVAFNNVFAFLPLGRTPAAHEIVGHRYKISHNKRPLSVGDVSAIVHCGDGINHRAAITKSRSVSFSGFHCVKCFFGAVISAPACCAKVRCVFEAVLFVASHFMFFLGRFGWYDFVYGLFAFKASGNVWANSKKGAA